MTTLAILLNSRLFIVNIFEHVDLTYLIDRACFHLPGILEFPLAYTVVIKESLDNLGPRPVVIYKKYTEIPYKSVIHSRLCHSVPDPYVHMHIDSEEHI